MSNYAALESAVTQAEAAAESIKAGKMSPAQLRNAIINMDRLVPNFGPSLSSVEKLDRIAGGVQVMRPITAEDFRAYVSAKRDMLAFAPK